jgi:hypothetical protein
MVWHAMCDMDGMGQVMASKAVGGRPVLPFAATYCQSPPMPCYSNGTFPVEPWAVEMLMTMPYEEGAAGVVMCKPQMPHRRHRHHRHRRHASAEVYAFCTVLDVATVPMAVSRRRRPRG